VEIVFVHDGPCTIQPTQKNADGFKIVPSENGTAVTVPAHPDFDVTHWQISHPQGKPVNVDILVRRIWWALGEENCEPSHWEDKQLRLAREHFDAPSTKVLWLRLPPDWSVKSKVGAGFKGTKLREYPPTKRNGSKSLTVEIPLREFSDAEQLTNTTRDVLFEVTVHNGETWEKAIVGCIPAAEHPKPKRNKRRTSAPTESVTSPAVASAETWRGIGRKKTAYAEAILRKGTGCITVNGQGIDAYFGRTPGRALALWNRLKDCLRDRGLDATLDIEVTVYGSSPRTNRQAKAISHAVARALMSYDPNLKPLLQQNGLGGVQPKTISFPGSVAR
jgi:small subunit ribosomal protein S9